MSDTTGEGLEVTLPSDTRAFRNALGRFTTGVTIVTARLSEGTPLGVTMNSFSSVSMDPPLVLFSVGHSLQSLEGLRDAEGFAIHVLDFEHHDLAMLFGRSTEAKWTGIDFARGFGGAPLLEGALALFECKPYARYPGGDHDIFVVEVVRQTVRRDGEPLVFFRGALRSLGPDHPATPEQHLAYYFY
jgi:flavin reductase (DIM6/NTAB) family NADH-FMN oxidoreductase RutF